jgi:hypothetical protein
MLFKSPNQYIGLGSGLNYSSLFSFCRITTIQEVNKKRRIDFIILKLFTICPILPNYAVAEDFSSSRRPSIQDIIFPCLWSAQYSPTPHDLLFRMVPKASLLVVRTCDAVIPHWPSDSTWQQKEQKSARAHFPLTLYSTPSTLLLTSTHPERG